MAGTRAARFARAAHRLAPRSGHDRPLPACKSLKVHGGARRRSQAAGPPGRKRGCRSNGPNRNERAAAPGGVRPHLQPSSAPHRRARDRFRRLRRPARVARLRTLPRTLAPTGGNRAVRRAARRGRRTSRARRAWHRRQRRGDARLHRVPKPQAPIDDDPVVHALSPSRCRLRERVQRAVLAALTRFGATIVNSLMRHRQPQIGVGEPAIQRADYASARHRLGRRTGRERAQAPRGFLSWGQSVARAAGLRSDRRLRVTGCGRDGGFMSSGKVPQVVRDRRPHACLRKTDGETMSLPGSWELGSGWGCARSCRPTFKSCSRYEPWPEA